MTKNYEPECYIQHSQELVSEALRADFADHVNDILNYAWDPLQTTCARLETGGSLREYRIYADFLAFHIVESTSKAEIAELLLNVLVYMSAPLDFDVENFLPEIERCSVILYHTFQNMIREKL